jgi:hypothetical protein
MWKIVCTGYGGSANGDITFTQELISATGIADHVALDGLVLFPMPVRDGQLNMLIDVPVQRAELTIIDAQGRIVLTQPINGLGTSVQRSADISALSAGVHVLRLQADGLLITRRVVIE